MNGFQKTLSIVTAIVSVSCPALAAAQATADELLGKDKRTLRGEIQMRYDAALALTLDPGVVSADNNRFMWASQAKAQCGIALGFLKSGTKDPVSIGKCVDAYNRMQDTPPPQFLPPPPPPPIACNHGPYIVFFEWDRADVTPEAATVLDSAAAGYANCSPSPLVVDGYTDLSGSDSYNQGLSIRRAESVRDYLDARGVPGTTMTTQGFGETNPRVPTADGVRELQNRRVEITIK